MFEGSEYHDFSNWKNPAPSTQHPAPNPAVALFPSLEVVAQSALRLSPEARADLIAILQSSLRPDSLEQEQEPQLPASTPSEYCSVWMPEPLRKPYGDGYFLEYWLHYELLNPAVACGREHRSVYIAGHTEGKIFKSSGAQKVETARQMVARNCHYTEILKAIGKRVKGDRPTTASTEPPTPGLSEQ